MNNKERIDISIENYREINSKLLDLRINLYEILTDAIEEEDSLKRIGVANVEVVRSLIRARAKIKEAREVISDEIDRLYKMISLEKKISALEHIVED